MYEFLVSLWRTVVPTLVGLAAGQAARLGFDLDDAQVTAWLTVGFTTVYYAAFRALERVRPGWGWFLGIARPPSYETGRDGALARLARRAVRE
ncbi:hypothetical protein ACFXAF_12290 [Kitasatospora sp. NPDC059463]|uniref:hypothetical protein n=1 Tax=unclassified Kitasatospora TaxID=2633591 RepID=UPI0036B8710C